MNNPNKGALLGASALDPAQLGRLHNAASRSDEAPAVLTGLATVIPCEASKLAAIRIEEIDRGAGTLPVAAPDGSVVTVAICFEAALAVQKAIGGRHEGFLVADPDGGPLQTDKYTLKYARELVADIDPAIDFEWSFSSIRDCIVSTLIDEQIPYAAVEAQMGLPSACGRLHPVNNVLAQRGVSEWWCVRAGLPLVSPFEFIDLAVIAASLRVENARLGREQGRRA